MPQLTFPIALVELTLPVIVGLSHQDMVDRLAKRLPALRPVSTTGAIDTGSTITCIAAHIVQALGIPEFAQTTTQTVSGSVPVRLFQVSLSISPAANQPGPMLTRSNLLVMELIDPIPGVEVLIGMDILLDCRLLLDGPGRQFTLDF